MHTQRARASPGHRNRHCGGLRIAAVSRTQRLMLSHEEPRPSPIFRAVIGLPPIPPTERPLCSNDTFRPSYEAAPASVAKSTATLGPPDAFCLLAFCLSSRSHTWNKSPAATACTAPVLTTVALAPLWAIALLELSGRPWGSTQGNTRAGRGHLPGMRQKQPPLFSSAYMSSSVSDSSSRAALACASACRKTSLGTNSCLPWDSWQTQLSSSSKFLSLTSSWTT